MINTCDVKKIQSTDSAMGKKKVLESTYQLHVNVVITRVFVSSFNSYHDGPFRVTGAF